MTALLLYPVRTLIAGYFYYRAATVLKAPAPKNDPAKAAEQDLIQFLEAIPSLERASAFAPSRPDLWKAQADIHLRLGTWMSLLETMDSPLPPGAPPSAESFRKAEAALQKAIRLEPTNADHHFALAVLYDAMDNLSGRSEQEMDLAIRAYPVNAALRNAVAIQHLLAGRKGEALEHASVLARIDDSGAYLMQAFEIAWRASDGDVQVVKGLATEAKDGEKAAVKFLASKGIREP
jgi:tetratricopeptide (TPR) repeat protein